MHAIYIKLSPKRTFSRDKTRFLRYFTDLAQFLLITDFLGKILLISDFLAKILLITDFRGTPLTPSYKHTPSALFIELCFYGISMCIWLILPAQSMGKLAKSLKNSIWYASKILNGTRYAEQNWEVRGTPWGEGFIASVIYTLKMFPNMRCAY